MSAEVVFYLTVLYLHEDVNAFLCLPCLIIAVLNANVKKNSPSLNNRVILASSPPNIRLYCT